MRDSSADGAAAPTALIDVTPTSPTLQAHPSTPGESKPTPMRLNGSKNGAMPAEPYLGHMPADVHGPNRTANPAHDSHAGIIQSVMKVFQDRVLEIDERCSQLAAQLDAASPPAPPGGGPPVTDASVLEAASAAVQEAKASLSDQKDAQTSYERRMKRFVQDIERMMKTLQDQLMGIDHYMQLQTSRVDQIAGDCMHHRELLQHLDGARGTIQEKQVLAHHLLCPSASCWSCDVPLHQVLCLPACPTTFVVWRSLAIVGGSCGCRSGCWSCSAERCFG